MDAELLGAVGRIGHDDVTAITAVRIRIAVVDEDDVQVAEGVVLVAVHDTGSATRNRAKVGAHLGCVIVGRVAAPSVKTALVVAADFNTEGMIHIGLLPELIEDARRDGVTDEQLEPIFRSAEAFIRLWERAEKRAATL